MTSIQSYIELVVEFPTEENKKNYLDVVNSTEYNLLVEAENLPYKSQEYFNKRKEAFTYRKNSAVKLINQWVAKYKTSKDCPVSYADTLIIPFQSIKAPKNV